MLKNPLKIFSEKVTYIKAQQQIFCRLQSATAATALAARAVGRDGRDVLCEWGKKAVSNKCKEREREFGTERVAFRRYHIFEISPPKIGKMSKTGINCFVIIATR